MELQVRRATHIIFFLISVLQQLNDLKREHWQKNSSSSLSKSKIVVQNHLSTLQNPNLFFYLGFQQVSLYVTKKMI